MKIALVNPPATREESYGSMKNLSPDFPLLGIAFLSSYLRKKGFHVDLLDHSEVNVTESCKVLRSYEVVGFSAYITNYQTIILLSELLKNNNPNIIVLAGGPHATLFPYELDSHYIDYVISGEGEIAVHELFDQLNNQRINSEIKGVSRKILGKFTYNQVSDVVEDLDSIGKPDVEKYDLSKYKPPVHVLGKKVIHTLTSRGCPFKCAFCAASEVMGRRIRYRGLDSIMEELKRYGELGYDSIMFYDDLFTLDKKRVLLLCDRLKKENLQFKWSCFTRTQCLDDELCQAMKDSGCYLVTFGCESANDKTLEILNKGLTHEINVRGIECASQAGILTSSSFMIGLPGESCEDIEKTINFAKRSRLTFAVFPIFEPFKGTPIYETCKNTGSWQHIGNESNMLLKDQEEIWVPHGLERHEVVLMARKAFRDFYFFPKRIANLTRHAIRLPPKRFFQFVAGGVSYFATNLKKSHSQSNTHY
ncbi:MAG: B12-binding domain-containing radical SAM protein [Proteobacteria bacterium]|nr:B12-binding domain-containing radical SAM protein [Pseudomonadota bacterium]